MTWSENDEFLHHSTSYTDPCHHQIYIYIDSEWWRTGSQSSRSKTGCNRQRKQTLDGRTISSTTDVYADGLAHPFAFCPRMAFCVRERGSMGHYLTDDLFCLLLASEIEKNNRNSATQYDLFCLASCVGAGIGEPCTQIGPFLSYRGSIGKHKREIQTHTSTDISIGTRTHFPASGVAWRPKKQEKEKARWHYRYD